MFSSNGVIGCYMQNFHRTSYPLPAKCLYVNSKYVSIFFFWLQGHEPPCSNKDLKMPCSNFRRWKKIFKKGQHPKIDTFAWKANFTTNVEWTFFSASRPWRTSSCSNFRSLLSIFIRAQILRKISQLISKIEWKTQSRFFQKSGYQTKRPLTGQTEQTVFYV